MCYFPHPTCATLRYVSNKQTDEGTNGHKTDDDGTDGQRTDDNGPDRRWRRQKTNDGGTDDGLGGRAKDDDGDWMYTRRDGRTIYIYIYIYI